MKQIIIDTATRREVREKFEISADKMSHVLKYELNSIRARKARSYILNFREYHVVSNNN